MKTLLLRILFAVFIALFIFFLFSAYQYYKALHSDDPVIPSVFVEKGVVTIVRGELAIDMNTGENYSLSESDTIITKDNTLAVVTWPDRSQTRLGANSRMHINRMIVATDYTTIQIEFALEEGQIWSTVVRTLYPGSYFRTRLPNQGVIAGVRGTVYDIDLARGYVRSLDHSVTLTDNIGNMVHLLPGELVSVSDILRKLTQEVVDTTWTQLNTAKDTIFLDTRRETLRKQIDLISGKSGGVWDRFVRWILSFIPTFDDLHTLESLLSDVPGFEGVKIPREQILRFYQKFQDTKFVQERERVRMYIESTTMNFDSEYMHSFARGAVWDSMTLSGITLEGAQGMIHDYAQELDGQVRSVMQVIPLGELDTKARETLRQLIK